ncbi:hypothetical protein [Nannocystis sp. SCPEA4]|uniref:hypothetical protein n=1 Tax=Nannocystis sp. SCPEA4 TaxID=2996787 RepID=UPI0022704866|nr:hypothetical protein [Nannocystis sp. SCPEA4]MCY1061593.1 hypothetical protein [Nannocystis sp. SCPEA4]
MTQGSGSPTTPAPAPPTAPPAPPPAAAAAPPAPAPAQARGPAPAPSALRSNAGQPANAPCATCQRQRPPPNPPCDYDKVDIRCKHCKQYDQREIESVWFALDPANGQRSNNLVRSPNPRRPFVTDRFEVVAGDKVTIAVSGGPGFHPDHPAMTVTPPAVNGPPRVLRGTSHEIEVDYEPNWFRNRIADLDRLGFAAGLRQFFFPRHAAWQLEIVGCGARPERFAFGRFTHTIAVYPKDTFKLGLNFPSQRRIERADSRHYDGLVNDTSRTRTESRGYARTSDSVTEVTRETPNSFLYRHSETSANRNGAVTQTRTNATLNGRDLPELERDSEGAAPRGAVASTARSFTFTHNGQDWSQSFKVGEFIDFIGDLRRQIISLIEFFKALGRRMPRIGWSFTVELDFFSGSLEYEWGYKEWKKDHTVYPWYKVELALTIVQIKVEIALGAELLGAKAQIYGAITGEFKVTGTREAEPDANGPAATISAAPQIGGEIGVRGALGDWVEVVGRVNAGFEGKADVELAPFAVKLKLELSEGKGTFTARSRLFFSVTRSATLWPKRLIAEATPIG